MLMVQAIYLLTTKTESANGPVLSAAPVLFFNKEIAGNEKVIEFGIAGNINNLE